MDWSTLPTAVIINDQEYRLTRDQSIRVQQALLDKNPLARNWRVVFPPIAKQPTSFDPSLIKYMGDYAIILLQIMHQLSSTYQTPIVLHVDHLDGSLITNYYGLPGSQNILIQKYSHDISPTCEILSYTQAQTMLQQSLKEAIKKQQIPNIELFQVNDIPNEDSCSIPEKVYDAFDINQIYQQVLREFTSFIGNISRSTIRMTFDPQRLQQAFR